MATTTNYSFTKPTINGSENTWGSDLNGNWDSVDTILYGRFTGSTAIAPDLTAGSWKVGGTAVTATAAELNILDGVTSTNTEINLLDGATGNTVVNDKAVIYGSAGEVTATTANITTVDFGDWTITESAGVLYFATGGTNKMKLDASGNLTVVGDITTNGTI